MRVKRLAHEHNAIFPAKARTGPLDPESIALSYTKTSYTSHLNAHMAQDVALFILSGFF